MPAKLIASRKDPAVLVRVPKPILKKVDLAARSSGRSRNSEILHRLADSFADAPQSVAQAA